MKHKVLALLIFSLLLSLLLAGCQVDTAGEPAGESEGIPSEEPMSEIGSSDVDQAEDVLVRYFSLLHQEQYEEATKLYGGDYDMLTEWNPTVDPTNHAMLLEMGCMINGLQCLPIKEVVSIERRAPTTFEFTVQFETSDGTVLEFQPEGIPQTESVFNFLVVKEGNDFLVQELPVYIP